MVFLGFCHSIHFTTFSRQCEYSPKVNMHYIYLYFTRLTVTNFLQHDEFLWYVCEQF